MFLWQRSLHHRKIRVFELLKLKNAMTNMFFKRVCTFLTTTLHPKGVWSALNCVFTCWTLVWDPLLGWSPWGQSAAAFASQTALCSSPGSRFWWCHTLCHPVISAQPGSKKRKTVWRGKQPHNEKSSRLCFLLPSSGINEPQPYMTAVLCMWAQSSSPVRMGRSGPAAWWDLWLSRWRTGRTFSWWCKQWRFPRSGPERLWCAEKNMNPR